MDIAVSSNPPKRNINPRLLLFGQVLHGFTGDFSCLSHVGFSLSLSLSFLLLRYFGNQARSQNLMRQVQYDTVPEKRLLFMVT